MLTETKIKQLKPKERRYNTSDSDGLTLRVTPTGVKTWLFRKRMPDGDEIYQSLGNWPDVSLFEARCQRDTLMLEAKKKAKEQKLHPKRLRFSTIAEDWMKTRCEILTTPKNIQTQRSRLDRLILPAIGDRDITEITVPDVMKILRDAEKRGLTHLAHRLLQIISTIFRHAIVNGLCEQDITVNIRGALMPHVEHHLASIQDREELSVFLEDVWNMKPSPSRCMIQLHAYTFVRPGEIRKAEWSEFNLTTREWKIPAEKMKLRRAHIVPLSRQSLEILEYIRTTFPSDSPWVFPSRQLGGTGTAMSNMTEAMAIRKLGYGSEQMTPHGFRSIASTALNENGWPSDAIERQLAHVDGNAVRSAYNYAQFMAIRTPMMQWYADWLDSVRLNAAPPARYGDAQGRGEAE